MLPPAARIMLVPLADGMEVVYRVSPQFALTQLDEIRHPEIRVCLEDDEAETMFWEALKKDASSYADLRNCIAAHPVGAASAVETLEFLGRNGRLGYAGIGVADADVDQTKDILHLPGTEAPEIEVFTALKQKGWAGLDGRFGLGAGRLLKYLDDAMLLPDHHEWTAYVGDQTNKSSDAVWEILVEEWRRACLTDADAAAFISSHRDLMSELLSP